MKPHGAEDRLVALIFGARLSSHGNLTSNRGYGSIQPLLLEEPLYNMDIQPLISTEYGDTSMAKINANFSELNTWKANDSAVIHLTGNETATGNKTFRGDTSLGSYDSGNTRVWWTSYDLGGAGGIEKAFQAWVWNNDGSFSPYATVQRNGNVWIWTTSPSEKLDVSGNVKINNWENARFIANRTTVAWFARTMLQTWWVDVWWVWMRGDDGGLWSYIFRAEAGAWNVLEIKTDGAIVAIGNLLVSWNILGWLLAPEWFLINWKIVPSVSGGNLTVALKTLAGTDASASNPIYVMIWGVMRTITGALNSVLLPSGTNWFNAGSAELATKEIDYFAYLGRNSSTWTIFFWYSRLPWANYREDFNIVTNVSEKWCPYMDNLAANDPAVNIGRFAATLSAGAGYTWSIPTYTASNLIQRPIYETRWLSIAPTLTWTGTAPTTLNGWSRHRYKVIWDKVEFSYMERYTTPGLTNTICDFTLPFSTTFGNMSCHGHIWNETMPNISVWLLNWVEANILRVQCVSVSANNVSSQWFYSI